VNDRSGTSPDRRPRAAIVSVAGHALAPEEARLLEATLPAGVILFARNCADREQLRRLTAALRHAAGDPGLPILIDQEGGRVRRLRPPCWLDVPAMGRVGELARRDPPAAREAARLAGALIGGELADAGITVDCAPVLDVAGEGMTAAIGDRAFSADASLVGELGRIFSEALMGAGVLPVIKHLPGHGRARLDSHAALPVVEADLDALRERDFLPFRLCRDLPLGMTAHVVFTSVDPDRPATTSRAVIEQVIRGEIGFAGTLMSDDLGMGALAGTLPERARAALAAGCDIALYCGGDAQEAAAVLAVAPYLEPEVARRLREIPAPRAGEPSVILAEAAADLTRLLSAV
jgi:beta-N-acetylhexosaminidase